MIKFADDYIQSNTTEIKGGATFGASGYSEVKDNGDVVVKIGGDATLDISKEYIHWDKNHSANYDITVKKSNTTDNTLKKDDNGKYAEYVVDVSSEKGTPDVITLNDVLEAGKMSVDTSKFTYTITKTDSRLVVNILLMLRLLRIMTIIIINIILQQRCLSLMPVKAAR